jgi:hypothetical protein
VVGAGWRRRVRDWPEGRRRWVAAVELVVGSALLYLALVGVLTLIDGGPPDWTAPVGPFLAAAVGGCLATWRRQRRMGGADRVRQYERAVKAGRLPDDADPAVWRPLLARQHRVVRGSLTVALALGGALVVVLLLLERGSDGHGVGLAVAAALVLGLVALWWTARRQFRRLDRLADQLPGTDPFSADELRY